ncbi:NADPH:quinone reductase [Streptomyces sp. cf386]|uniref:zinc-dependent alcohol dehydrogenase family protein n=1 Tax=Streptomyces sp. cf386 TaxID=1761904 RepID=UPI00088AAA48|nr:zinc-dependent alcohol dehydrogenase family protein [Streptomyces sp. cf386]SDP73990.1 NADPH:quinone reductase [Streptomyces sp. cf386]
MSPTTARTVLFHETGGPEVLTIENVPVPEPGPGQVTVRVEAFGLNRAEALFRAGTYYYQPALPASRLGYEASGVVEAIGDGVTALAVGDPVLTGPGIEMSAQGVYAERVVLPETAVLRRPASVDAVTGAAAWLTYTTAYGALLETAGLKPGDHVLITGASSGVGTAAIQVARRIGAIPLATTRTEAKRQLLLDGGAAEVIVSGETSDGMQTVAKETRRLTDGRGAQVVFDAIGGPAFQHLGDALAEGGTLVVYGWLDPRPAEIPRTWPFTIHTYANLSLTTTPDGRRRSTAFLNAGLTDGGFRPVIAEVFEGLDTIREAHRLMESNMHTGKIVVRL